MRAFLWPVSLAFLDCQSSIQEEQGEAENQL